MKGFIVFALAIIGNVLLINWSEQWYGEEWFTEWLIGLVTVGFYALFLYGWKQYSRNGLGLIFITAFVLLTINSIFFVQIFSASVCSFLLGLILMPLYVKNRDAVVTSWGFVLLNILILTDVPSEVTTWMLFLTTGIASLVGFRFNLLLLKRCFTVLFALTALLLLFFSITNVYLFGLVVVLVVLFTRFIYKFSRPLIK